MRKKVDDAYIRPRKGIRGRNRSSSKWGVIRTGPGVVAHTYDHLLLRKKNYKLVSRQLGQHSKTLPKQTRPKQKQKQKLGISVNMKNRREQIQVHVGLWGGWCYKGQGLVIHMTIKVTQWVRGSGVERKTLSHVAKSSVTRWSEDKSINKELFSFRKVTF